MSLDTIDDLEAAEDMIGLLADTLKALAAGGSNAAHDQAADLRQAVMRAAHYCRPSCNYMDEGECESQPGTIYPDDDSECACPCGHGWVEDTGWWVDNVPSWVWRSPNGVYQARIRDESATREAGAQFWYGVWEMSSGDELSPHDIKAALDRGVVPDLDSAKVHVGAVVRRGR